MVQSNATGGVMEQGELFDLSELNKEEEIRTGVKTKVCSQCLTEKPATTEYFNKNMNDKGIYDRLKHICRCCVSHNSKTLSVIRRTAPPTPQQCECCGVGFQNLNKRDIHLDHCKKTDTFRGWLCKNCNVGLGMLGDDEEGLKQAIEYLERASKNGFRT